MRKGGERGTEGEIYDGEMRGNRKGRGGERGVELCLLLVLMFFSNLTLFLPRTCCVPLCYRRHFVFPFVLSSVTEKQHVLRSAL